MPNANIVAILVLMGSIGVGLLMTMALGSPVPVIVSAVVGVIARRSPRIARQWDRAIVLRLVAITPCALPACSGSCRLSTSSDRQVE